MATTQGLKDPLRPYKEGAKEWEHLTRHFTKGSEHLLNEESKEDFTHLKEDLMLYGEAAQATYDTVDLQQWSRFRDKSRFAPYHLLGDDHLRNESHFAELPGQGYSAAVKLDPHGNAIDAGSEEDIDNITYMYASEKSDIVWSVVRKNPGQKVTDSRVWIGYVAYSRKREDILVAWRGTQQPQEWLADGKLTQVPYHPKRQASQAADDRSSRNPPRLLAKVCKKILSLPRKIVVGSGAGLFSLAATVATPLLGLLFVLTSLPPEEPKERPLKRQWIVRYLFKLPAAIVFRLGVAALPVGALWFVQKAFPSTLDLGAFLLTLPFAFIGAIPVVHVMVPKRVSRFVTAIVAWPLRKNPDECPNLPYLVYVGAVAIADVALRIRTPPFLHGFWATPPGISLIVFAASGLLPLTCAAVIRAGAQAAEWDEAGNAQIWVHEGFHGLYTTGMPEEKPDDGRNVATPGRSQGTGDLEQSLIPGVDPDVDAHVDADVDPEVHQGVDPKVPPKKASPQTTLHRRIKALLNKYGDHVSSISVTGHSLGGALAVLSSFDLVKSGCNVKGVDENGKKVYVPVTCYSYEGPRVGNLAFADEFDSESLKKQGLTAIRIVNEPDIVPDVPRAFYLQNVYYALGAMVNQEDAFSAAVNWVENVSYRLGFPTCYRQVGSEINIDSRQVKWIKKMEGPNPLANAGLIGTYHNLEVVLHVLSGYNPSVANGEAVAKVGFGARFTRDFALANKSGDNLNPRFGIAPCWHATLVDKVATAKYPPSPEPSPELHAKPPASDRADDRKKKKEMEKIAREREAAIQQAARDSDATRYPDPRPAIIQPYDATQSPPNWGADEARVIGQGPQDPESDDKVGCGKNQWLEDIHSRDQAWFDKFYGLKASVEEKGGGAKPSA